MSSKTHEIWNIHFIEQIIDTMADGVFTLDNSGRVTSWNRSMERISGYTAEEAMGHSCQILKCSRCFGKKCPSGIRSCQILKKGKSEANECLLMHKAGHNVAVIKNARVVRDQNEQIIGVVETVTDLSEISLARQEAEEALIRLGEKHRLDNLIGKSHEMQKVFAAINAAAASDATILIVGESGTGKELVAGAIHQRSTRKTYPLIAVNCSALTESLLESELFGHVKGAFTGATRNRTGRFEEADGGTVFLDEIGEISPYIQVKLLRVLQEREIERVGDSKTHKVNIRIMAATNRNLYSRVQEGHFRDDLYYRLKVFPIVLPPLRNRRDDIPLLTRHFIDRQNHKTGKNITGISQYAMRVFLDHSWPGNVRELENAIEHAFVLCNRDQIEISDLPLEIRQPADVCRPEAIVGADARKVRIGRDLSGEELVELLETNDWNKAAVARQLGVSRTAVWKYMKKWNIPLQKSA
ncbi:sigma-54 interaction domain-containing protein [Thermodesulfobacteriota bacterium]